MAEQIYLGLDIGNLNGNLVGFVDGRTDLNNIVSLSGSSRVKTSIDTTALINKDLSITVPLKRPRDYTSAFAVGSAKRLLAQEGPVVRTDPRSNETREVQKEALITAVSQAIFDDGKNKIYENLKVAPDMPCEIMLALTYPASFMTAGENRQKALLERYRNAVEKTRLPANMTFSDIVSIPEPAAAALSYLYDVLEGGNTAAPEKESLTVLVFDLGHGTLDIALVQVSRMDSHYRYNVLHTDGALQIGGEDFDKVLWDLFLTKMRQLDPEYQANDAAAALNRLKLRKEKEEFSDPDRTAPIRIDEVIDGKAAVIEISKAEFEEASAALIDEARQVVERVLQYAEKRDITIDRVISTGGAGQMPQCLKMLVDATQHEVTVYDPFLSVAKGALRYLALSGRLSGSSPGHSEIPEPVPEPAPGPIPVPVPNPEPESDPEKKAYTVTLHPACQYGVLVPSNEVLGGELKSVITPEDVLPFTSPEMELSGGVTPLTEIRVYLFNDGDRNVIEKGYFVCTNFDIARQANGKVKTVFRLDTDMRLSVTCTGKDGHRETITVSSNKTEV